MGALRVWGAKRRMGMAVPTLLSSKQVSGFRKLAERSPRFLGLGILNTLTSNLSIFPIRQLALGESAGLQHCTIPRVPSTK